MKEPWAEEARAKAHAKASAPEWRRRISEARRGKPTARNALQPRWGAWRGPHHSAQTHGRMSRTHRKRGMMVPGTRVWTRRG